ncbi:putative bifunctional diguanylate cyclase/phosphodiesterase [Psychromonas sp. L1A2]|uniref:putative bifunctional diguanylate cyclase/phosphodiesterase n=1 Tax=Psychromonas sp. L1A2 TaxID=2686356 RepID=UPI0013567794|nr:EAL domain-containing protein [Psychromonas sp. L1A2]
MNEFFIAIIIVGTVLLLASLMTTLKICQKSDSSAWYLLFYFIILFIIGYLGILYYFLYFQLDPILVSTVACILFGGGGFVYLVIKLSYSSLLSTEEAVEVQRYQAEHDILTGLPNRKMFFKSLSHIISQSTPCSVLFIDLNDFKQVNDSFGHYCGDQLLIATAHALKFNLSDHGSLFRLAGDEFAILSTYQSKKGLQRCINLITKSVQAPLKIDKQLINVNLSIGVSHYPQDSLDMYELVKHADLAMYEAKRTNKNLVFYDAELSQKEGEILLMTNKIKGAIEQDEFLLFYQPLICTKTNQQHGLEVLIRWPQPDGSFLSPDDFIMIAERSSLILSVTKWVVIEAIKNLKVLQAAGFTGALHINLSAQDLKSHEFYDYVAALFKEDTSISDVIVFEITESAMMTNIQGSKEMIMALNAMGFQFSIDDFGTGFSSLSLLRELSIKQIKIDRSFVDGMLSQKADYAIVKSIIFLAKQLECEVIAEGIENRETEQELINLDCDYLQGFYYSKPISIEEIKRKYLNYKAS